MFNNGQQIRKLAVDCQWLHRTLAIGDTNDPYRMLCTHIIRDGDNCVGPLLENLENINIFLPKENESEFRFTRTI